MAAKATARLQHREATLPSEDTRRISVVRGREVVPLLPGTVPARRVQPWRGVLLERHAVGGIEIPEHVHNDFCLHLQTSGSTAMEWWSEGQNRVETTTPGSMILLGAGTRDRLRWQTRSQRLIVSIQPELLQEMAAELGGDLSLALRNRWALRDAGLANLLREMDAQAQDNWPLGGLYADLLGAGLATTLLRRYAAVRPAPSEATGKLPMAKLRRAMEFMNDNLHRELRLEEIAREAGLSAFHFAREFRATAGQTPYQYLLDQRMARAQELLRVRTNAIQDVARETGFSSAANFVRAFRQRVGVTPGEWQAGV